MATAEEIIAEEWRKRATELADWAMLKLVNRRDVWGQYAVLTPTEQKNSSRNYKAMTLPATDKRDGVDRVTLDKLTRHFASRHLRKPQLIGLHAKSKTSSSRWFGIDIDNHASEASSSDDLARRNLNAAVNWHRKLQAQGYDPLLFDSNGAGGYHLWVLFDEPAPTADVFAFAMDTVADWEAQQLDKHPETFPKRVKDESLGSWFRLPGLHHTRPHHAAVWAGEEGLDEPWLRGHAAIDLMLHNLPGPPPPAAKASAKRHVSPKPKRDATSANPKPVPDKRTFKRTARATVAVDLDGVLAHKTGNDTIGPPIDGAVEFTRSLAEDADILIFTARFSTKANKPRSASVRHSLHKRIETWLNHHGFAWDEIVSEGTKPIASAYIDDRAVPCRPINNGLEAYDTALTNTQKLL